MKSRYSLKKRISFTYALVYILVCVFILGVFFAFTAVDSASVYEEAGDRLLDVISEEAADTDIGSYDFRIFLNSLRKTESVSEIWILDKDDSLVSGTTSLTDRIEDIIGRKDLAVKYFPAFAGISEDSYFYISDMGNFSLIICFDAGTVYHSLRYALRTLTLCMFCGFAVFIFAGYYRMNRMLSPISEMTEVTKKINADNLDLRLDVTKTESELNELAVTINDMIDRLQISYDKQKRFVSDVSHELRTPIAVIAGYGSMLKRWGKDDEEILNESIESIISECDNMKELVEKLLFLTRHDNDRVSFDMTNVNISELVASTVKEEGMVHPDFTFGLECESGIIARADETRFKQALRIFLDNAVKYSGDSRQVDVTLKRAGAGYLVSVRDYGIGISREDLPNIFERFYRADTSRTKETGGYGLGLAIAKIIVDNHAGVIRVRSKEGEGSEFSMIFRNTQGKKNTSAVPES